MRARPKPRGALAHGIDHHADVLPVAPNDNQIAVSLGVLVVRILSRDSPCVLCERRQRLSGTITTNDKDFTRPAFVHLILGRSRAVKPQRFDPAVRQLRLDLLQLRLLEPANLVH